jgi:hypothetical protein
MSEVVPTFTFDVKGLQSWANASGNQFAVAQADVQSGRIQVFSVAWNEFGEAYEDDVSKLAALRVERKPLTEEHRMSIIAIADRAKATFGRRGPNDNAVDWKIAGVAACDRLVVITDQRRKHQYASIDGITAITFEEYIVSHELWG